MGKLLIGWGEATLVPDKKVNLAGQFYERITDEVRDPIAVTALAVEGEDIAIFCSCDLESTSYTLLCAARDILKNEKNFPYYNKVIVNAIHSHTSISYSNYSDAYGSTLSVLDKYIPEGVGYEEFASADSVCGFYVYAYQCIHTHDNHPSGH